LAVTPIRNRIIVEQLAASEYQLKALSRPESDPKAESERRRQEIEAQIEALG